MHYVLTYELAPDYLERREALRPEHLQLAWDACERGELVLGGALGEPAGEAIIVFSGDSADIAKRFAESDPYVREGLVTTWSVRPWTTVVGELASTPVKP